MTLTDQIQKIEDQIDDEYRSCFPSDLGWESASLYLLLVFDWIAQKPEFLPQIDTLKYPLMHSLRWGRNAVSKAVTQGPAEFDEAAFKMCYDAFWRASEYVGLCGAFISFYRGIVSISEVNDRRVVFTSNPDWHAYEVLDERMHDNRLTEQGCVVAEKIGAQAEDAARTILGFDDSTAVCATDLQRMRDLVQEVDAVPLMKYELPGSWSYDGISIAQLRRFWNTLFVFSQFHLALMSKICNAGPTFWQLLAWPRSMWVENIHLCSSLDRETIERLLDLMTYSRDHKTPDIALTPFLPVDDGLLVVSPWLLGSSNMERNFCAHLGKQELFAPTSDVLDKQMAAELAQAFQEAGFKAMRSVSISTNLGPTDIDLLVWSPREKFAISAELKWLIEVADFMEVLNRGESRSKEALEVQLPKHDAAFRDDAPGLVQRAF